MFFFFIAVLAFFLSTSSHWLVASVPSEPSVCKDFTDVDSTNYKFAALPRLGCVRGAIETSPDGLSYSVFRGIPYAKAPTVENDLRFKKPVAHPGWLDTPYYDAINFRAQCMQIEIPGLTTEPSSEDCLYLNIWVPESSNYIKSKSKSLPVMFFIHGGAYEVGAGSIVGFHGSQLAVNNDVIVVTFNYRLATFGFLYSKDSNLGFEGNYGYYDQLLALRWVYNNIEYFGGSKKDIVVFGQSAGAQSAANVLMNYGAKSQDKEFAVDDMIKGVILNSPVLGWPQRSVDDWEDIFNAFVTQTGCGASVDVAKCLRSEKSSEELFEAQQIVRIGVTNAFFFLEPWTPTFRTDILPQKHVLDGFETGQFNQKVPIIIGNTRDETKSFIDYMLAANLIGRDTFTPVQYQSLLEQALSQNYDGSLRELTFLEDIQDIYQPVAQTPQALRDSLTLMFNEMAVQCPSRFAVEQISKHARGKDAYLYTVDYFSPFIQIFSEFFLPNAPSCYMPDVVCHGADISLLFLPPVIAPLFQPEDVNMGKTFQRYFANLAEEGDPGAVNGIEWTAFANEKGDTKDSMLFFNDAKGKAMSMVKNNFYGSTYNCNFWDDFKYYWLVSENDEFGGDVPSTSPTEEPEH